MAHSIRNPTALLTLFTAFAAAAPQRGHGSWPSWNSWNQPAVTVTSQAQAPVITVTAVDPQVTVTSSLVQASDSGNAATIVEPITVVGSSSNDDSSTIVNPTLGVSVSTQAVPTQADPTQGGGSSASLSASSTQATETGSSGSGGSSGGGCQGSACRPGGKKAGVAGADGVTPLGDAISWFYDWSPSPSVPGSNAIAVPMLWGNGQNGAVDAERYAAFSSISQPDWILGFNEPDIGGDNSANMQAGPAAQVWNDVFVPKIGSNTKVGSPAPAIQLNGQWLGDFKNSGISVDWDITAIHIYQTNATEAKAVVDYYAGQFPNKAIWVTEFGCADTSTGFVGCTDQNTISSFITEMVDMLEAHESVQGYAAIVDGYGLSEAWSFVNNGQLTTSGNVYLSAISKY